MMGVHQPQKELFSYQVDLDRRVRADHPLRRLNAVLDLSFVRSNDSIVECSVEPMTTLKQTCGAVEAKLDGTTTTPDSDQAVADRTCSATDPVAAVVRKGRGDGARARHHHHRAIDDPSGVITAIETTTGAVAENRRFMGLAEQAEANTEMRPDTLVADRKYVPASSPWGEGAG